MKKKNNIFQLMIMMVMIAVVTSCGHEHTEGDGHDHGLSEEQGEDHSGHDHGEGDHDEHSEGGHDDERSEGIHLSSGQMEAIGLEFGELEAIKVNDFISATGTLGLPPNAYSGVTARTSGIVKGSNKYVEGDHIKKGVRIAYIENPEIIDRQMQYLEGKAELEYLRTDLERQRALVAADAGVTKSLQKLESEFAKAEANLNGTAKHLQYLGIDPSSLTADNIRKEIAVTAPITGYITSLNLHNGLFVDPQMELMEIVDDGHLHLELDVFEKDISKVEKGQRISYSVPAIGSEEFSGEVAVIGKEFDSETKTVRVHGHLEEERPPFIKDLFIRSKIWLTDATVQGLPSEAIIRDGMDAYIFASTAEVEDGELSFVKLRVTIGAEDQGFSEVRLIDPMPDGMKVVVKGAYYVDAQSKAGELEHEH